MYYIISRINKLLLIVLILIIAISFILKGVIARAIFKYETSKINKTYSINITANKIKFKGVRTILIQDLTVTTIESDTIAKFGLIETKLSLLNLLVLKINPIEIKLNNSTVNIHQGIKYSNINNGISTSINVPNRTKNSSISRLNSLFKSFFGLSTARFNVENFTLSYKDSSYYGSLNIPNWKYKGNKFTAKAKLTDSKGQCQYAITGITNKKLNKIGISIIGENGKAKIPFLESFLAVTSSFDSAYFELQAKELLKNNIKLQINARVKKLQLVGKRIAETTVETDSASANIIVNIAPHSYCIDSLSEIRVNMLSANIGACYHTNSDSTLSVLFKTNESTWQKLIESLPNGLFSNLIGMKINGSFHYSLLLNLNIDNPDSLSIEPNLISKGFFIQSYGNTNFSALNDTFTHKVYTDALYLRSIHLGESNKNYTTLANISPYIQWAIITSEDGGFYNHRGFDLDGIRYAMVCNIKERRFARGGSTISQQLIKNLYLNQNKNITRKFEELLIVWMIENSGIVSKERMLEIYLNIIEWGPNVYGVKEACKYYFNKKPNEISLQEALFLAYIVPRPSKFKYVFEDTNHLKPFMLNSFNFVSQKMLTRGYITEKDYNTISNIDEFNLSGEAIRMLAKDTIQIDSTEFMDYIN